MQTSSTIVNLNQQSSTVNQQSSTVNQQISILRSQTKTLIKNLWNAAHDHETFESVLGPIKNTTITLPTNSNSSIHSAKNVYHISSIYSSILLFLISFFIPIASSPARQRPFAGSEKKTKSISPTKKSTKQLYRPSSRVSNKERDKYTTIGVISRPKPIKRNETSLLQPSTFQGDVILERDDAFFEDLQEFRKLYPDSFMKSALDPHLYSPIKKLDMKSSAQSSFGGQARDGYEKFRSSIASMNKPDTRHEPIQQHSKSIETITPTLFPSKEFQEPTDQSLLKNLDHYSTGYFRVDPHLSITKHEHPFKNMDDVIDIDHLFETIPESQCPCKVSIPFNTISLLPKTYLPKTRTTFTLTKESVNLADVWFFSLSIIETNVFFWLM